MYRTVNLRVARYFFILGLLLFISSAAVGQWQQTAGPEGREIVDLYSQGDTAYAATGGGVYFSVDSAASWHLLGLAGQSVQHIWAHGGIILATVVDSAIGQFIGSDVYRSSDRGATWNKVTEGLANNVVFLWAFGAQDSTFYVSASLVQPTGFTMLRSTDAGISWIGVASGPPSAWVTGFASLGTTIFASTSQGIFFKNAESIAWKRVAGITHPVVATSIYSDGSTLYCGSSDGIYSSVDQGATWKLNTSVLEPRHITGFLRSGQQASTVIADDSVNYYFSSDQGAHWTFIIQPSNGLNHLGVVGLQSTKSDGEFLICTGADLYALQAPFQSFTLSESGILNSDAYTLQMINGALYAETKFGIDRTTDGGQTWTHFASNGNPGSVSAITHLGNYVFVGGTGLYRTTNNAAKWDTLTGGLNGFQILTALTASGSRIYAGSNSLLSSALFISSDSGATWHRTDSTIQGIIYSIYAQDSLVLVLTSDGSFRSVDYGATWRSEQMFTYYKLFGQTLAGNGTVILTSANGLERTVDGGITWRSVAIPIADPSMIESVSMNGDLALAGTTEGVYLSTDAGQNWRRANDGLAVQTPGIAFDGTYLYAGTLGSAVWKASFASVGVSQFASVPASELLVNYPNPFRSQTTIGFTLAHPERVTLEVYDALGRKIETLFDGEARAGENAIQLNSTGLTSGIYFVRLRGSGGMVTLPITLKR